MFIRVVVTGPEAKDVSEIKIVSEHREESILCNLKPEFLERLRQLIEECFED